MAPGLSLQQAHKNLMDSVNVEYVLIPVTRLTLSQRIKNLLT